MLFGTAIAILIYFGLMRHLVDPVVTLRGSIEEIRGGNFELTLPEPRRRERILPRRFRLQRHGGGTQTPARPSDESLVRANNVTRSILEAIPSPVFILEDDSGIVQINPAAKHLSENLGVIGRLPEKIQNILDKCGEAGTNYMPDDPRDALLFRISEVESTTCRGFSASTRATSRGPAGRSCSTT